MKTPEPFSRRSFLAQASGAVGSGWLAAQWPLFMAAATAACQRREADTGFAHLAKPLADTLEAVAEQIIPSDDTPGAREAGVTWFIDQLLGGPWAGMRTALEAGATDLDDRAGPDRSFIELSFDEQTAVLKGIENGAFFSTMRLLTLAGMFAMPGRGGNREKSGWRLVGFEDRHAWQPPFGHYDATPADETEGSAVT